MAVGGFIILFSLLLYVFEIFYNERLLTGNSGSVQDLCIDRLHWSKMVNRPTVGQGTSSYQYVKVFFL